MARPVTIYRLCVDVDVLGQPVSWSYERLVDGERVEISVPALGEAPGPFDTRREAVEAAWDRVCEREGLIVWPLASPPAAG